MRHYCVNPKTHHIRGHPNNSAIIVVYSYAYIEWVIHMIPWAGAAASVVCDTLVSPWQPRRSYGKLSLKLFLRRTSTLRRDT